MRWETNPNRPNWLVNIKREATDSIFEFGSPVEDAYLEGLRSATTSEIQGLYLYNLTDSFEIVVSDCAKHFGSTSYFHGKDDQNLLNSRWMTATGFARGIADGSRYRNRKLSFRMAGSAKEHASFPIALLPGQDFPTLQIITNRHRFEAHHTDPPREHIEFHFYPQ